MVLAAGHYKQTQRNYIVAAVINIVISVLTVKAWGLIGIAIGTLAAMVYQTVWLAVYDSRNFVFWPMKAVVKQFAVDSVTAVCVVMLSGMLTMRSVSYISWIILAMATALLAVIITVCLNFIAYKDKMMVLIHIAMKGKRK